MIQLADPSISQFLTRDPLDAQTGQAYEYAGDNPINLSDPSGLLTVGFCPLNPGGIIGFLGISATACVQVSSSGDVGATATVGGGAGGGISLNAGPGITLSNANHISELNGKFYEGYANVDAGGGIYGEGFYGLDACGQPIYGGTVGDAAGIGAGGYAGESYTVSRSLSIPKLVSSVGDFFGL
jgi:hypothetical protein